MGLFKKRHVHDYGTKYKTEGSFDEFLHQKCLCGEERIIVITKYGMDAGKVKIKKIRR